MCRAHEESSASPSIQSCTASWRAGESFDGDHHPTAGRTRRQGHTGGRVVDGGRRHRRWTHTERVSAAWQCLGAAARRQETVEANPDEALREHVEAEAAEEFLSAERHQSGPDSRAGSPSTETSPGPRSRRRADGWRSRPGGCTARDSAARDWGRRMGAWRRRPSRGGRAVRSQAAKAGSSVSRWRSLGSMRVAGVKRVP